MYVIASHGKGHKSAKDSISKVKSWCAKCQEPVCRMHTITIMYLNTRFFTRTLDLFKNDKCVMYLKDIIFERSLSILFFEERYVFFWEKKFFFLACNTHFISNLTIIAHYLNSRLQAMYWNVSIFNVSKRAELCHICFPKMGTLKKKKKKKKKKKQNIENLTQIQYIFLQYSDLNSQLFYNFINLSSIYTDFNGN